MPNADGSGSFVIGPRAYDDADVVRLVAEVQAEYVRMYGGPDAAAVDPDEFVRPNGVLLVGMLDGEVVAMGGWRRLTGSGARAELKRMYVVPRARRRGLSRRLLTEIERDASAAGITEMVLNTGPAQHAAIGLYLGTGYAVTTPFGHYAMTDNALFYKKPLSLIGRTDGSG